jgi:hypothetical protein
VQLDRRMEELHREVHGAETDQEDGSTTIDGIDEQPPLRLWERSRGEPQHSTDTTAPTHGPRSQAESGWSVHPANSCTRAWMRVLISSRTSRTISSPWPAGSSRTQSS